jgi:putative ABC transport system ATP-binding protein
VTRVLFSFDRVVVERGGQRILDDLTVEMPDQGVTVILGPSGAGKSTLLRLCNRLDVPSTGQVSLRGAPLEDLDPLTLRRRVGMVFQRPTPFAGSVRENLRVARPECPEDLLVEALDRVGLPTRFLGRTADDLSGGEAQRMCLARTLLTEPEVLLMDEPTSALDLGATRALERLTCSLVRDRRVPALWVTHDLSQAERIADQRVVLVAGRVADEREAAQYYAGDDVEDERA